LVFAQTGYRFCAMREVMFVTQLGLGDYFITNGLLHHLKHQFDRIYIPVKVQNLPTIECLYKDTPTVIPFASDDVKETVENYYEAYGIPVINADVYMHRPPASRWYRWYYEQFRVPYEWRFSKFQLPVKIPNTQEVFESVTQGREPYRLVHDMPSDGQHTPLQLNNNTHLHTITLSPTVTPNLLSWLKVIQNAAEIHVIDSSVWNWVHSMSHHITGEVFYHGSRRSQFTYEAWDIMAYSSRTQIVGYP
jgi:hypothetical protein